MNENTIENQEITFSCTGCEELQKEINRLRRELKEEKDKRYKTDVWSEEFFSESDKLSAMLKVLETEGIIEPKTREVIGISQSLMVQQFKEYDKWYNR